MFIVSVQFENAKRQRSLVFVGGDDDDDAALANIKIAAAVTKMLVPHCILNKTG